MLVEQFSLILKFPNLPGHVPIVQWRISIQQLHEEQQHSPVR